MATENNDTHNNTKVKLSCMISCYLSSLISTDDCDDTVHGVPQNTDKVNHDRHSNVDSHISSYDDAGIRKIEAKKVIVAMIGIGKYDENINHDLIGVYRDYCNVKYTFNFKRGYHVIYNKSDNKMEYISNRIKKHKYIKDNFKLQWTKQEIYDFNKLILKTIADSKSEFDGLIYLVSCHGDRGDEFGDIIYSSDGDSIKIRDLLTQFSEKHCAKLRNKPKIAILDFCRGQMRMKKEKNSAFQEMKICQNNSSNKPKTDDNKNNKKNNNSDDNKNNSNVIINANRIDIDINDSYDCTFVDREIYGNLSGYATIDGGGKGGYLIRSFTKIMGKYEYFNLTLDEIIMQTKKLIKKLLGSGADAGATVIEDLNRLTYCVKFCNNEKNVESYVALKEKDKDNENKQDETEFESTVGETGSFASIYKLTNPLVVLVCIGKYCQENEYGIKFSEITGKSYQDYVNSKYFFNHKLGYSMIYMVDGNSNTVKDIRHLRKGVNSGTKVKDNFKLEWNYEEIEDFNEMIKTSISSIYNNKTEDDYDGLIYIISGHGSSDDEIYDSNGEEYSLPFVFEEFNNLNCKELRNLPKIFIIDTDRGDEEIKMTTVDNDNTDKEIDDAKTKDNTNTKQKIHEINDSKENKENTDSASQSVSVSVSHYGKELSSSDEKIWNQRFYCKDEHFRIIYTNVQGYKKVGSIQSKQEKGSHLIRAFTKIVGKKATQVKDDKNENKNDNSDASNLNDILLETKHLVRSYLKKETKENVNQTRIVEDSDRMPYFIKFEKR